MGCLAASLVSTYQMLVAPLQLRQTQTSPDIVKSGRQIHPQLRTIDLDLGTNILSCVCVYTHIMCIYIIQIHTCKHIYIYIYISYIQIIRVSKCGKLLSCGSLHKAAYTYNVYVVYMHLCVFYMPSKCGKMLKYVKVYIYIHIYIRFSFLNYFKVSCIHHYPSLLNSLAPENKDILIYNNNRIFMVKKLTSVQSVFVFS